MHSQTKAHPAVYEEDGPYGCYGQRCNTSQIRPQYSQTQERLPTGLSRIRLLVPLQRSNQRLPYLTDCRSHLAIALHSPEALIETGLHMCPLEKSQEMTAFAAEQSVLCSPVCLGIIAKYGHCSRISAQSEWSFRAVQTVWRRKRDSNSRYGFVALRLDVSASCR